MRRIVTIAFPLALFAGCTPTPEPEETAPAKEAGAEEVVAADTPKDPTTPPEPEAQPISFARVDAVQGAPTIKRGEQSLEAMVGVDLQKGDSIDTGDGGKVRIVMADKSVLALGARSKLTFAEYDASGENRVGTLKLTLGRFWMNVTQWAAGGDSLVEVYTPNAVAGVRGTTLWGDIEVDAICSLDGEIEVRSLKKKKKRKHKKDKTVKLTAGHCASKLSKGKLKPFKPTREQVQGFLKEVLIQ